MGHAEATTTVMTTRQNTATTALHSNHMESSTDKICSNLYSEDIETIRKREYPLTEETTYLDHAGTTLFPKSMIESYTAELTSNLFGNPHSASASSQLSSRRIEDIRLQVLKFFRADPHDFDLVFVANATSAIKLVADAFRDHGEGFWYGYHGDSHTSLIGVRELAKQGTACFRDDTEAEDWIRNMRDRPVKEDHHMLFGYPGQSNMTGRQLPYQWCSALRQLTVRTGHQIYTLFDAAALAATSLLDLSDSSASPDFTAVSFYKIFGFPDLGALILRKASSHVLRSRRYFGGGTVDAVSMCEDPSWHMKKQELHSSLEDGTLPFHNIIALEHAMRAHTRLFGSMANVRTHTKLLCTELYTRMHALRHDNGASVCQIHSQPSTSDSPSGPVVTFNLLDKLGEPVSNSEVEKLGIVQNIQFRTGGLCNPGGIARCLKLNANEMKANYAAGHRCGNENDIIHGKPTGAIRLSLGAMSSHSDVNKVIQFLEAFYVSRPTWKVQVTKVSRPHKPRFSIESMSVFPIKSCSAFHIPANKDWEVSSKGLAWDREWCLVHQGTNIAISQKQHPRMALIRPAIDLNRRVMIVSYPNGLIKKEIEIGLDDYPSAVGSLKVCQKFKQSDSTICGESVSLHIYTLPKINEFFSDILGVPCALARFFDHETNTRFSRIRKAKGSNAISHTISATSPSIKLSNESPILLISRSSINRLNQDIRRRDESQQEILPEAFRANVVVSEQISGKQMETPYAEDNWDMLTIESGNSRYSFDVLGPCRRCQMVCVDQNSAKRRQEPFSTLAKTRRWDGGVWFGAHLCLVNHSVRNQQITLRLGDAVIPS